MDGDRVKRFFWNWFIRPRGFPSRSLLSLLRFMCLFNIPSAYWGLSWKSSLGSICSDSIAEALWCCSRSWKNAPNGLCDWCIHDALINAGEALAGGLFLEGGAGVCEHHYSRAPEARMSALNAIQLGAFYWFLGGNHRGNNLDVCTGLKLGVKSSGFSIAMRTNFLVIWVILLSLWLQIVCLVNEKGCVCSFEGNIIYFLRALEPDTGGCYYQPTTSCHVDPV